MKPLGRKHYKNNTGGKHHCRINGKYQSWWEDVCTPNKELSRRDAKEEMQRGIDEFNDVL